MFTLIFRKSVISIGLLLTVILSCNASAKSSVWQVSKGDDYIYVGGTVHILPPTAFPLPKEFNQAYQDSDSIVLEAELPDESDPAFQLQMMQTMTYANGKTINDFLSVNTRNNLNRYVKSLGTDMMMLQHLKPGFLTTMFAVLEVQRAGLAGEGVDIFYSKKAVRDNKNIDYFETADFQMRMISVIGLGNEEKFIKSNLKQMQDFKKTFTGLLDAWRKGDEKKLVKLAITPLQDDPKTLKSMLIDRNRNWVKDVKAMFTDKEREFVLVGVAHLVGNDSLLDLLKKQGYQVKQL